MYKLKKKVHKVHSKQNFAAKNVNYMSVTSGDYLVVKRKYWKCCIYGIWKDKFILTSFIACRLLSCLISMQIIMLNPKFDPNFRSGRDLNTREFI